MRIAVVGGTGVVGRHVVDAVRAARNEPVVLTRSTGVDLITGAGLEAALAGADAVVDAGNVTTNSAKKAVAFFATATGHLVGAARAASLHIVALSITGIDRVPFGYYEGKLRQEQVLAESGVPHTIVRATQFHEFAGQVLERVPGPIAVVPKMRIRPISAAEVGKVLAELATGAPSALTELAGPQEEDLPDLVRRLLRARGSRKPVLPVRLPGNAGKAMVSGGNLPTGEFRQGRQTFQEWLDVASFRDRPR